MKPRLLHVTPWDLTVGGFQRMIDLWCARDAGRWDTHIISKGARGPFQFAGATVHAPIDGTAVDAMIRDLNPDLLVHHGCHLSYGRWSECPVVWIVHGMLPLRASAPTWCKPAAVLSNLIPGNLHPSWQSLGIQAFPLGVDLSLFHAVPKPLVCGIVGRLSAEKVPGPFVEMLAKWDSGRGPWTIRFVGTGRDTHYQPWVHQQLDGCPWVEFLPDVAPDQMAEVYRTLDAVMVPTDAMWGETGCYTAVEAMASGVPVVARDVEGLHATCGNAALYATTDDGLLKALRLLDDPLKRHVLVEAGHIKATRDHDVTKHVAAHSRIFREAIDGCQLRTRPVLGRTRPVLAKAVAAVKISKRIRSNGAAGRLRIGLIQPALYWGGAERVFLDLARFCHDVDFAGCAVVSQSNRDGTMVDLFSNLMPVYEFGRDAVQAVARQADILVAWGSFDLQSLVTPFAGPVVFVGHGSGTFDIHAARLAGKSATHHVAVAEAALPPFVLAGIDPESVTVIHNGIDPARCAQTIPRNTVRARIGVGQDDYLVGYLGRLVPEKNPAGVARAVALLPPRFKACFVGSGWDVANQRAAITNILGPRAIFVDRIEDVGNYLAAFDCFALASPAEGFSMAMLEAMLRDLLCVLTNVGVLPELDRKHGRQWESIPPNHEPKQFAAAIVRTANLSPEAKAARTAAARAIVERNYLAEHMAANWTRFLHSAAESFARKELAPC